MTINLTIPPVASDPVLMWRPRPTPAETAAFEDWWSCWSIKGTKRGKVAARRWYERAMRQGVVDHATLCAGVRAYMAHCAANDRPPEPVLHRLSGPSGGRPYAVTGCA